MKVLSLFSGVGGFDLGLEAAGMETVAMCEWDKKAASVLRRHWPDIPVYGDVSDLTGSQLIADGVFPDLVAFGSPCQDLSVAGKRAGLAGERSGLFHEAIRIIRELRELTNGALPRWVIWENVVGALNSNGGEDFKAVLDEMGNLGAHLLEWAVMDAQNYGVPQRRRRVFLVACLDSRTAERCPDPLLPLGQGRPRDIEPLRKAWKNASRTAEASTRSTRIVAEARRRTADLRIYGDVSNTLMAYMGTGGNNVPLVFEPSDAQPYVKARRAQSVDDNETWVDGEVAPTLNAFNNGGESRATVLVTTTRESSFEGFNEDDQSGTLKRSGGCLGGGSETFAVYGISGNVIGRKDENGPNGISVTDEDGPMFTLTTLDRHAVAYGFGHTQGLDIQASEDAFPTLRMNGSGHAVAYGFDEYNGTIGEIHNTLRAGTKQATGAFIGSVVRRLTPLECERLMGWPDHWTRWDENGKEQADSHRYKQTGNGVASPVAAWLGRQIFAAEHSA